MIKTKKEVEVYDYKEELKAFLVINMPAMFDRNPNITGDLDKFVEKIIKIVK